MPHEHDALEENADRDVASAALHLKRSFEEMGSQMEILSHNMTELAGTFEEIGDLPEREKTNPVSTGFTNATSKRMNHATGDD